MIRLTGLFDFAQLGCSFSDKHFLTNLQSTPPMIVSNLP